MIRALSLAAALAVLPISGAVAQDDRTPAETAIEAAAEAFEARMAAFGERAEAIADDERLTETQREARIAALWTEYAPDVEAFTARVSEHAGAMAAMALADIDIDALVAEALSEVDEEAMNAEIAAALSGIDVDALVAEALEGVEMADIDVDAAVAEALASPEVQAQIAAAARVGPAMVANGAWAQNDPEQRITYGLIAQHALDQAMRTAADAEEDAGSDD